MKGLKVIGGVGGGLVGGPGDHSDSLSQKIRIWDLGLRLRVRTSGFGLRLVNCHGYLLTNH